MTDRKKNPKTTAGQGETVDDVLRALRSDQPAAGQVAADASPAAAGDIAAVTAQRDEYLDHLRRLQAEFDNYRKRVQRDSEEQRLRAAEAVVESLLPVVDNMARALDAAARHEEGQLIAGVELVDGQLRAALEAHGLDAIDVEPGTLFDPTVHEAVLAQPSDDFEEGAVIQVLESGYLLHGRLLRPARVIVAS